MKPATTNTPVSSLPRGSVHAMVVFVLLLLLAVLATARAQDQNTTTSRYQRITQHLQVAAPEDRRAFARVALEALAEVYIAEADLARRESVAARGGGEPARWAHAVDDFNAHLLRLLAAVEKGVPVSLPGNRGNGPAVVEIEGERVMLSHPREGQQAAYEQAILSAFCRGARCELLEPTAPLPGSDSLPVTPSTVNVDWAFSAGGAACSADGITLAFEAGAAVARTRDLCEQLHLEIAAMLLELRWQSRRGVVIDWPGLALRRRSDQPGHVLQLNPAGDAALLKAPLVASSPGLLRELAPWLRSRVGGEQASIRLSAADWGWVK